MRILGMGIPELVIIIAVILIIFGPRFLPKLGSSIGKAVKGLREGMGGNNKVTEASDDAAEAADTVVVEAEEQPSAAAQPVEQPTEQQAQAAPTRTVKRVVRKSS